MDITYKHYSKDFEDINGVIGLSISKKNRQRNDHKKNHKRANNDIQNIQIKLKTE